MSLSLSSCPICSADGRHVRTMPVDAMTFKPTAHGRVHRCNACSFEYIAPRPTPQETAAFYDIDGYYTQGGFDHSASARSHDFLSRLRNHLAWRVDRSDDMIDVITRRLPRGAAIVDVGSGDGSQIALLSQRGFRMTGVERDVKSASLQGEPAQVFEGSAEALPEQLPRGGFDAVMFKQVLEHLVDPVAALRNAAQLLKPAGVMFVEVPNNESAIARQSGLSWQHMDVPRHINFFTQQTLQATATAAGLAVEGAFFNEYCRYFADGYVATEQRIHDHLGGAQPAVRNSAARSWALLLRTLAVPRRIKYDCVGVVAVKPG
jgi:2-polyprenyl-3-methyl-5-hydroxy-6-metoxy-1,4-benzoquinol methylase